MCGLGVLPGQEASLRGSGEEEDTMYKIKMLVLTALAAATVGMGALAAAPSAFALPSREAANCGEIAHNLDYWNEMAAYWQARSYASAYAWQQYVRADLKADYYVEQLAKYC